MSTENIISVCILIAAVAIMIGLAAYKNRKDNKEFTIDEFIDKYYDNIIDVLQDAVSILQVNIDQFDSKESFDKAIINITITKLKENVVELGIDNNLVNLFNTDALTDAVYRLFCKEEDKVFSAIGYEVMQSNPELYNSEVIDKLKNEEENV